MRTRTFLLISAILIGGIAIATTATGAQSAEPAHSITEQTPSMTDSTHPTNESTNPVNESTNDTAEAGVCMIGVESPCNGEKWDGGDDFGDNETDDSEAGVCVIGADSECNAEEYEDGENHSDPGIIEPVPEDDREAGICLVGADSGCNGDEWTAAASGFGTSSPVKTVIRAIGALF